MTTKNKQVELRILIADEGMILTDGENYSSVGGQVYLGKFDSPDSWHEITELEYQSIQATKEAQEKAELEKMQ